ncbi:MAG: hypothetical protein AAFY02_19760 [Pseudomonadota bacterium]
MDIALLPALVLVLAFLATVAGLVEISAYFPLAGRPPAFVSNQGLLAIFVFTLALLLLPLAGLAFAWSGLGWPFMIILGGLAVLAGPVVWQATWQGRVNSPPALLAVSGLYLAVALLLFSL